MNEIHKINSLVTVAITTWNRPDTLGQAIKSALDQSYKNLEVIVLDDCSPNLKTKEIVQEFMKNDKRLKYYRHDSNIGVNPNFDFALSKANGKYFMWLCDDDWIDKDYVASCLNTLIENKDYILVTGKTKFYRGDEISHDGIAANLLSESSLNRWMSFYVDILGSGDSPNFGLIELNKLRHFKMPNIMGCDYILFSRAAYIGKIKTLENVCIHRRLGGMSESMESIAVHLSLSEFDRKFGFVSLWINIFKDFVFNPIFKELNVFEKLYIICKINLLFCFNMPKYFTKYNRRRKIKDPIKSPATFPPLL